jgi:enoyl-CoA hydratase
VELDEYPDQHPRILACPATVATVSSPVSFTLEDKVAVVQMDDGKANALSQTMIDALRDALARAEREASALILAGRTDRFCAGFDLKTMMSSPAAAATLLRAGADLLLGLYGSPIPVVIACTGHALAGGALIVLTGDYRIGTAGDYKIGLNEVAIGLPVPVLAMELARDRLSKRALTHATLLAQIYDPPGAQSAGYLDAVEPANQLLARARAEATRLAGLSRGAFQGTKKRLRGATIDHIRNTLDADMTAIAKGAG